MLWRLRIQIDSSLSDNVKHLGWKSFSTFDRKGRRCGWNRAYSQMAVSSATRRRESLVNLSRPGDDACAYCKRKCRDQSAAYRGASPGTYFVRSGIGRYHECQCQFRVAFV